MERGERKGRRERRTRCSSHKAHRCKESGLYGVEELGKDSPAPLLEKFRVEDRACQPGPVTGRDCGIQGEPGGQVCSDAVNSHFSHLL